ncbi:MAG: hypothetical protein V3T86_16970 [Planctomycetota bacterium]
MVACGLMVAGFFLPWTPLTKTIEGSVGVDKQRVVRRLRSRESKKDSQAQKTAANRVVAGQSLTGSQW